MAITTTAERLRRAIALGRELRGVADDPQLHSLSAEAWRRHALRLGGFAGEAELAAAIEKLECCPFLLGEVRVRAKLWANGDQDRPAPFHGFDGSHIDVKAYAERLSAGLSVAQLSAIAAIWCAERRPPATFGRLDDWGDLVRLTEPRERELAELDAVLTNTIKVADLSWRNARPYLEAEGVAIALEEHVTAHLASELALAVGRQAPAPGPAVPVA